jgi:hypothetical protein
MHQFSYRWRAHPATAALEREVDTLKITVIQLRRDLTNKTGYATRLELVLRQRMERIDQLNGQLEQVREQNRRLDAEAEHYFQMLAAG